jgi:hypothetical protein
MNENLLGEATEYCTIDGESPVTESVFSIQLNPE